MIPNSITQEPQQNSPADVLTQIADLIKRGSEHQRWNAFAEAESLFREAIALADKHLGKAHQVYGYALCDLAVVLEERGERFEARDHFTEALTILEKHLGNRHDDVVWIFMRLHHLYT